MTFNVWTFLFEVLNFLVLAFVLHRLLYRPLREAVERRQQAAAREREEAAAAHREAEALQQRWQRQLAEQEHERQQLLHEAHEQAEAERKKLLADSESLVRARQEEQRRALEREREEVLQALQGEVTSMALDLARRLLAEAADATLHRQLALRLVETLQQVSEDDRGHLQAQWQSGDGAVLETAQKLDEPTLGRVAGAVAATLGRPVTPAVQLRPELLGGVRLRLGGQVWDASLAGQLGEGPLPATEVKPCRNGQDA
jgi:F-type H+-transporting ATPase subunit b